VAHRPSRATYVRAIPDTLAGSWVELRIERKSLLQMLDEDADFSGHPPTGRPHRATLPGHSGERVYRYQSGAATSGWSAIRK
jgi:hypothetical protein